MSHYTVLVIGDNIEAQLAPFDENIQVDPYKSYVSLEPNRNADGSVFLCRRGEREGKPSYEWPIGYVLNEHPELEEGFTAAQIAKLYNESLDADDDERYDVDENGLYSWSTYNPQSKWDWYTVGGRWAGTFLLKDGALGARGEALGEWATPRPQAYDEGGRRVDQARKGDIDWERMRLMRAHEAEATWLEAEGADERDRYWRYGIEKDETHDEYILRRANWRPYSVLAEGVWREPGQMGWFGVSHADEADKDAYGEWWDRFFAGLPDEALLTVVDCHI